MVVFSSMGFIFRFLPIFLIVYYLTPPKYRNTTLLVGSIVFYAIGEPVFILLLLLSIAVNYYLGMKMWESRSPHMWQIKKKKGYLIKALVYDAGLLAAFKAAGIFISSDLLPLGLSFYTFKMISYQVDIYRGQLQDKPTFKRTALYFSLFPQVVSGPIMRYQEAGWTLSARTYSWEQVEEGLKYFVLGLGMKVLLADRIALLGNDMRTIGLESVSTPLAWLGAAGYSLQLYFDFWGYSLMASGLCVMLGFPFILNFNHPYAARSVSEFYRRWHVTLGRWFKDYIYIPLGGSRAGRAKTISNMLIVWLITGLWHGSGVNFVIWGLLLFIFVAAEKLFLGKWLSKYPAAGHIYVLFVIPLTWVVFSVTDLSQLGIYFCRLFPFIGGAGIAVNQGDFLKYAGMYWPYLAAGAALCVPAVYRLYEKYKKHPVTVLLLLLIFWQSVYYLVSSVNNPFLYFKF